jgi:hypothetical protein
MCLAYFIGKGYSEGFTGHMQSMLELLEQDVPIRLTVQTDEICKACPNNHSGICKDSMRVRTFDLGVLKACALQEGDVLPFFTFARAVQENVIRSGKREEICGDCSWDGICRSHASRWKKLEK